MGPQAQIRELQDTVESMKADQTRVREHLSSLSWAEDVVKRLGECIVMEVLHHVLEVVLIVNVQDFRRLVPLN
jgi:hypothetical protein